MDYKLPKRVEISNKSTYGKVLNIAGSDYMPGAAYLSSVSALKIGCGYCFLATTDRVIQAVAAQTQNIVFIPIATIEKVSDYTVIEIGCGLSQNENAEKIFNKIIEITPQKMPIIIDADGLNILAKNTKNYIKREFHNVVLTPHPKEAARLLNTSLDYILKNTTEAAIEISSKYKCITVLKTHNTIVCKNNNNIYINNTGNNSMAKAGSGDVLTGMISGLIAQGMDIFKAASLGVYLHGLSGDLARKELTEYSVMAEDLISYLPKAIKCYLK